MKWAWEKICMFGDWSETKIVAHPRVTFWVIVALAVAAAF